MFLLKDYLLYVIIVSYMRIYLMRSVLLFMNKYDYISLIISLISLVVSVAVYFTNKKRYK